MVKLIFKGILFWAEILLVFALILSLDILTVEAVVAMLITAIFLGIICKNVITINDLVTISGYKWLKSILK